MEFGYIIFYVQDVKETVEFYKNAFRLKCIFLHEGNDYAEMETGATALAFAAESLRELNGVETLDNRKDTKAPGLEISFVTKNVQDTFEKAVKKGAISLVEPKEKPWGQTVAYLKDNNGILIALCSPMSE